MLGFLTEEDEWKLLEVWLSDNVTKVTPPEFVRYFTNLYMLGYVWTREDKIIRFTDKGRKLARELERKHLQ